MSRTIFHWRTDFFYTYNKKRHLYASLLSEIESKQVIILTGLRRTGKTTLLKQLINYLIKEQNTKRQNILFYTFDEEQPDIQDIIREYEKQEGVELFIKKEKVYVFLDEIQKLKNWQNQIKYFYDNYLNIKFFITGSTSLFIKNNIRESLAGRTYEYFLSPLHFSEFLMFKEKDYLLKKEVFSQELQSEFLLYQKRQFIDIIDVSDERVGQYVQTMIEKIIYQDIPTLFTIEHKDLLLRILKIVEGQPGLISDYEGLSKELGINRITLSNYFFYLEESFLIKKVYNFSKNQLTSEKKMKKFYLTSTSFFSYLYPDIEESKLVENLVAAMLETRFFWRTPQHYEVDFIVEQKRKVFPIEVKYKGYIHEKEIRNILRFCEKFKAYEGLLLTKNKEGEEIVHKTKIKYIPVSLFLAKIYKPTNI